MTDIDTGKVEKVRSVRDYLLIAFGVMLYAVGWGGFLLPYKVTIGGTAGIATLVYLSTGISIQITYTLINVGLLLGTARILGRQFTVRTVFGVLMMNVFTLLAQEVFKGPDGAIIQILGPNEGFMACIIGAGLCGTGLGIVFLSNGSTGGTDIIAAVVNKYRDVSLGRIILFVDLVIVSMSYFIDEDWKMVLMGLVTLFFITSVLDFVVDSARQSVQFFIFSQKYDEIADRILEDTGRGVTVVDGKGWYSKNNVKVIMVLAKNTQSTVIFRLVKDVDPDAFVAQSSVIGVYGEGFDRIKVK